MQASPSPLAATHIAAPRNVVTQINAPVPIADRISPLITRVLSLTRSRTTGASARPASRPDQKNIGESAQRFPGVVTMRFARAAVHPPTDASVPT